MKAIVLEDDKKIIFTEVPFPDNPWGKNGVLVKIRAAGICNSDINRGFHGGAYHYPLIMGHELAGEIVALGNKNEKLSNTENGETYQIGDKVTIFPLIPCGRCIPCQAGDYAQCLYYDYFGSRRDGGFAEYLWVPTENIVKLPNDNVNFLHAAMTEPAAVALHGVKKMCIKPGSTSAVFGGGPIGNMVAQFLRISGCNQVIVVDIDNKKLEIAKKIGFVTVNPRDVDPVKQIYDITNGYGTDCTVEAVGSPLTFLQTIQSTGRFGQVLFLGNIKGEFKIDEKDFSNILRKEITIFGTWNSKIMPQGKNDWTTALSYICGSFNNKLILKPLISHTPKLEDGPRIFKKLTRREDFFSKIIFTME